MDDEEWEAEPYSAEASPDYGDESTGSGSSGYDEVEIRAMGFLSRAVLPTLAPRPAAAVDQYPERYPMPPPANGGHDYCTHRLRHAQMELRRAQESARYWEREVTFFAAMSQGGEMGRNG
jgi:hypothetical protein